MDKPVFVVSDVHVGAISAENERLFLEFLDYAAREAAILVINGDLFDIWVPSRRFVLRAYVPVIAKLAQIVKGGLPVYFVGGNHDALEYGGEVLREDTGVTLLEDPTRMQLGAFRTLIAHGDGVRMLGRGYRKEHPIVRRLLLNNRVRSFVERVFPIDWLYKRVRPVSRVPGIVARHERGEGTGPKPEAPRIESWAREQLKANPDVDLLLVGHSHLPALVEVDQGRFYVNTGDWIEHMSYGVLPSNDGRPEIRRWPSPPPGVRDQVGTL